MARAGLLLFVALIIGCARAEEPTCWVEYHRAAAVCSEEQFACQKAVDSEVDQQRCNDRVEECWAELGASTKECAGRGSCTYSWWHCMDECDAHHCLDDCWGGLYACADWYATDCEEACLVEASRCVNDNAGMDDAALTGQSACLQTYHLDCVPACYPDP